MDSIPKRSSLVAQTAAILRESMQAGLWQDILPGELELCGRFQGQPRDPARGAPPAPPGGLVPRPARETAGNHSGTGIDRRDRPQRPGGAAFPVSLEKIPATALFWVDALRDDLAAAGYRLEFHASQACSSPHPEHMLESLVRRFRPAGWVLYLSTAPVQAWFSGRALPCVISGSRHPNVDLSSVDMDYAARAVTLWACSWRRVGALWRS